MTVPPRLRTVDAVLESATVLDHAYTEYDTEAALHRLGPVPEPEPLRGRAPVPAPGLSRCAQAERDLGLAATLIVNTPQAAASLGRLVDHRRVDPSGALVFAALLHLSGRPDGAQFWWQFAAGAGDPTAAFCLMLLHEHRAEFRTARYWRTQSAGPRPGGMLPLRPLARKRHERRLRAVCPREVPEAFLPENVRHELIGRCRRGDRPDLPPAVRALVHSLPVEGDDADFGEIPRPGPALAALRCRPPAAGRSLTAAVRRAWTRAVIQFRTGTAGCRRLRRGAAVAAARP
jgi:hypothetical protein